MSYNVAVEAATRTEISKKATNVERNSNGQGNIFQKRASDGRWKQGKKNGSKRRNILRRKS